MTDFLEISLFGRVEFKQDQQPLASLATRKTEGLLIYLVCTGQLHYRDVVAELFWPERPKAQARHNLRATLSRLRQPLGMYLLSTRETVAFDRSRPYRLDVAELEQQVTAAQQATKLTAAEASQLAETLTLYQGDFLAGFHVKNAPDFEAWATMERERLYQLTNAGLHCLISAYLDLGDYKAGIEWSRRLLLLNELDEVAHRQLMELLALNQQRDAALAQYDTCCRLMVENFGAEPAIETVILAEQIRRGELLRLVANSMPNIEEVAPTPVKLSNHDRPDPYLTLSRLDPLPHQQLFGIDTIKVQLEQALQAPDRSWLLAIDGIGGIGKTTLAHALVHQLVHTDRFYDIGWVSAKQEEFIPSVGVQATGKPTLDQEILTDTLLEQLDDQSHLTISFQAKQLALIQRLKARPYLVVVDNLESVIDYENLLPYLRQMVNPSKVLLTTRYSLQAQPDVYCQSLSELSQSDVLALLRYQADLRGITVLNQATPEHLEKIYNVVGGNPLALKMIVGQLRFLSLNRVLNSLTQARGKSVQALYTYIYWQAWHLMNIPSRQLLLTLPLNPNSTFADLLEVAPLPETDLQVALRQLIDLSLVEVGGNLESPTYRLHRLTETFLLQEVLQWQ